MTSSWHQAPCAKINQTALAQAQQHQARLTKPAGSLGQLEDIAIRFTSWSKPRCDSVLVRVFAGDHGVTKQDISAFPQAVTQQMIANFVNGGAAINVLSERIGANFAVVNMGTVVATDEANKLINAQLMPGTEDFTEQAAMSEHTMLQALEVGREQVEDFCGDLFIGGEMGIGNTTSASAIYSLLLNLAPEVTVGAGTGVDQSGLKRKQKAIYRAINFHGESLDKPLDILRCVGGLEIAGLVGAYIACAQQGTPILIDGFISTAAALLAVEINSASRDWMLFAHKSAEPAHSKALEYLQATPLLDLGLRLGEGSGAATAVPLIQSALALHNNMATFADAGVSANNSN